MRTTLALDDDVVVAARNIARRDGRTMGEVVSDLVRRSLKGEQSRVAARHDLPIFDRKDHSVVVTLDLVNALRDDE